MQKNGFKNSLFLSASIASGRRCILACIASEPDVGVGNLELGSLGQPRWPGHKPFMTCRVHGTGLVRDTFPWWYNSTQTYPIGSFSPFLLTKKTALIHQPKPTLYVGQETLSSWWIRFNLYQHTVLAITYQHSTKIKCIKVVFSFLIYHEPHKRKIITPHFQ